MEEIFSNPGFRHIAGKICWNLDVKSLQNLSKTCEITKSISENVFAWLRKNLKIKLNHSKILIFAEENRKIRKLAVLVKTNLEQKRLRASASRFGLKMSNPLDWFVILDQTHLVRIFNSQTQNHLDYAIWLGSKYMAEVVFEQIRDNILLQKHKFTPSIIDSAIICCDEDKSFALEIVKVLAPIMENPIAKETLMLALLFRQFEIIKILLPLCIYQRHEKHVKSALIEAENQRNIAEYKMRNSSPEFIEIIELFKKWLVASDNFQCKCQKNISKTNCEYCALKYENEQFMKRISQRLEQSKSKKAISMLTKISH